MKVKIDSKNRKIILTASGRERKVINLIVAFAGGSVKNVSKSLIEVTKRLDNYEDTLNLYNNYQKIKKILELNIFKNIEDYI